MNYSKILPGKVIHGLRRLKAASFGFVGRIKMLARQKSSPSPLGTIVLFSLGGMRGSPILSREISKLGYDLHVLSPEFPSYEAGFAKGWTRDNLDGYSTDLHDAIAEVNPRAVMVEQRNILLPLMAKAQKEHELPLSGTISHLTSNSKIQMRKAIDHAKLPNLPWTLLKDYNPDSFPFPFMLKPEKGTGSRGVSLIRNDFDLTRAKQTIADLENDPTVGGEIILEAFLEGRQFDVEGVCHKGKCYPLSLTEEQYDIVGNAFPSTWYLFSPPIEEKLRIALFKRACELVHALGVRNGAFHCEMRIDSNGQIFPIDYSNRMGYPKLVSHCSGQSFPGLYVQSLVEDDFTAPEIKSRIIFQRFVRDEKELARFKLMLRENRECALELKMLGSTVAGVKILARIAIIADGFPEMKSLLARYDLVPAEWESYYQQ